MAAHKRAEKGRERERKWEGEEEEKSGVTLVWNVDGETTAGKSRLCSMYRRISMSHGLEPIKTYDQFSVLSALFRVFFFSFFLFFNFSSSNAYLEWIRMEEGMFYRKEYPRDFFHLFHSFFSVFVRYSNK